MCLAGWRSIMGFGNKSIGLPSLSGWRSAAAEAIPKTDMNVSVCTHQCSSRMWIILLCNGEETPQHTAQHIFIASANTQNRTLIENRRTESTTHCHFFALNSNGAGPPSTIVFDRRGRTTKDFGCMCNVHVWQGSRLWIALRRDSHSPCLHGCCCCCCCSQ